MSWTSTLAVAAVLALLPPARMHPHLDRAEPARDTTVALAPERLRLYFSEAIEPRLSTITLVVPGEDAHELGPVERGESAGVLVVPVPPGLAAGEWTVRWRVVGSDGHPVEGEYGFTVQAARAPPPPPPSAAAPPPPATVEMQEEEPGLTVESPAWIAARWITFAAMLTVIGTVALEFLVLRPTRPRLTGADDALEVAGSWGARIGRGAALFLALSAGVRLLLQVETLGGFESGLAGILLFESSWGLAWWIQLAGAIVAAVAFHLVIGGRSAGWFLAAAAAIPVALGSSLSSHAAASDLAVLAVTADALHILAVSAWLGTLLVLMSVGVPAAMSVDPRTGRFSAVSGMVATFSPRALTMAAIGAGTGLFAAIIHLPTVPSLWATDYGRTLLLKLGLVAAAAAIGFVNWRRLKPGLETGDPPSRIRRSAAFELLVGGFILLVTAVLVAVPPP